MQRDDDFERRFIHHGRIVDETPHRIDRRLRRGDRSTRDVGGRSRFLDREHRENPVADEFEDLAAVIADRGRLGFEQGVEDRDHPLARHPVRTFGEAAQIG